MGTTFRTVNFSWIVCFKTVSIISWIIWYDLERSQHTVRILFVLNSFLVWSKGSTRKTFWKLIYKFSWLVWRSEKTTNRYILNRVRNFIMWWIHCFTLLLVTLSASWCCMLQEVCKVQYALVLLIGQTSLAGVVIIFKKINILHFKFCIFSLVCSIFYTGFLCDLLQIID